MKSMTLIRTVCLVLTILFFTQPVFSQNQPTTKTSKPVKASEDLNRKSEELNRNSDAINQQTQQTSANMQATANNVKAIIKVFEPILRLRLKKQGTTASDEGNSGQNDQATWPTENTDQQPQHEGEQDQSGSVDYTSEGNSQNMGSQEVYAEDILAGIPIVATEAAYNTDGTANLGNQNNQKYGCYLDIKQGGILDEVDASSQTRAVDIIFTATDYYGSAPMYALLTPSYVKNDNFSNYFFRGPKYKDANIPVKQWEKVNESEIALTSLTPEKFEKIKDNSQLMAVVKQAGTFKDKFESRTKLDGKILAIKTEMGDRTAYGLIYIVSHYGTTGENGYLKIKLKVTGFDANGDGNADSYLYSN